MIALGWILLHLISSTSDGIVNRLISSESIYEDFDGDLFRHQGDSIHRLIVKGSPGVTHVDTRSGKILALFKEP